jgi:phage tail-like protein
VIPWRSRSNRERSSSARTFPGLRWLTFALAVAGVLAVLVHPVGAPPPEPTAGTIVLRDPAGDISWTFEACRALGSEHEVIERKVVDGSGATTIEKLPGSLRFLDLECSRPVTDDLSLWQWRQLVELGDISAARRDIRLELYDERGGGIDTWDIASAWPSRLEAAIGPNAAIERVRFVMDWVVRTGGSPPTPTPAPTATPNLTPTVTPTPIVPTPTPTPIPPENVIFEDGFESTDTSAWSDASDPT